MQNPQGRTFECDKLIRFHHCDPAGIVFYPQYFVLFNELVEDWFNQALEVDFAGFHVNQHLGVPMGSVECRFVSPSKVGELLRLSLRVEHIGTSSMRFAVRAAAGGQLRVQATLTVVLASMKTHRAVPITGELRDKFSAYLIDPDIDIATK